MTTAQTSPQKPETGPELASRRALEPAPQHVSPTTLQPPLGAPLIAPRSPLGARGIVALFGGTRAMARAGGWPPSTVQSWKTSGRIPARRQPAVLATAAQLGLSLSADDFFPSDFLPADDGAAPRALTPRAPLSPSPNRPPDTAAQGPVDGLVDKQAANHRPPHLEAGQ